MRPLSVDIYCRQSLTEPQAEAIRAALPAHVQFTHHLREPGAALGDPLEIALSQSWQFPDAREVVGECTARIELRETSSWPVTSMKRLEDLQKAMRSALEIIHADAIHCADSEQVIPPGLFLGEIEARGVPAIQAGAVNVRLFPVNVEGVAPGRLVMDTLGLHMFGLPDLQIDFRWLEAGSVARTLFAAAGYLAEHGDVIDDGHTIEGCLPGTRWSALHGRSAVEPNREVLVFDPGEPYSTRDE